MDRRTFIKCLAFASLLALPAEFEQKLPLAYGRHTIGGYGPGLPQEYHFVVAEGAFDIEDVFYRGRRLERHEYKIL